MIKTRVAIIFGGRSGEHDVSIRSAKTVIEQIDKTKYEVTPIAINRDGKWLSPKESIGLFPSEVQALLPTNSSAEVVNLLDNSADFDVIFPVLHGTFGEDGTVQGLFEMANIPYVGCGVLASSCGMDKVVMKALFADAGLPMCKFVWFLRSEWEKSTDAILNQISSQLGFPCFVKPANLGSSVGVTMANDVESLRKGIELASEYDRKIIVEEGLDMREIECAILGNDEPNASLPGEYLIHDQSKAFLDYTEKYTGTGNNDFVVPAPVSDELTRKIKEMAVQAFKAIDGSGLARVDFFLRKDSGMLLINEINTLPGLTDASGYPKMWAGAGLSFSQVIDTLIMLAFERHRDNSRNKTSF
jgi:D-alanine-D-alanine ligase